MKKCQNDNSGLLLLNMSNTKAAPLLELWQAEDA